MIVALLMMLLLAALGGALTFTAIAETRITGNYRSNTESIYAADAAIEVVLNHLVTLADWSLAHAGAVVSPFVDGPPNGARTTVAGFLNLLAATNELRSAPMGRPWQLYAYGPLHSLLSLPALQSEIYVVVWIAPHPAGPSGDTAILAAQAFGPYGVRRTIEATIARTSISGVRVTSWREVH